MPMFRLGAYLDAAPVRRRLRAALAVCFFGSLALSWGPAIADAWRFWFNAAPVTQAALDEELKTCQSSPSHAEKSAFFEFAPVGEPGFCHKGDAAAVNETRRNSALDDVRRRLAKPVKLTFLAFIVALAVWIVIPLAERSRT